MQDEPILGTKRPACVLDRGNLLPARCFPEPWLLLFAFFEVELLFLAARRRNCGTATPRPCHRRKRERQHCPEQPMIHSRFAMERRPLSDGTESNSLHLTSNFRSQWRHDHLPYASRVERQPVRAF